MYLKLLLLSCAIVLHAAAEVNTDDGGGFHHTDFSSQLYDLVEVAAELKQVSERNGFVVPPRVIVVVKAHCLLTCDRIRRAHDFTPEVPPETAVSFSSSTRAVVEELRNLVRLIKDFATPDPTWTPLLLQTLEFHRHAELFRQHIEDVFSRVAGGIDVDDPFFRPSQLEHQGAILDLIADDIRHDREWEDVAKEHQSLRSYRAFQSELRAHLEANSKKTPDERIDLGQHYRILAMHERMVDLVRDRESFRSQYKEVLSPSFLVIHDLALMDQDRLLRAQIAHWHLVNPRTDSWHEQDEAFNSDNHRAHAFTDHIKEVLDFFSAMVGQHQLLEEMVGESPESFRPLAAEQVATLAKRREVLLPEVLNALKAMTESETKRAEFLVNDILFDYQSAIEEIRDCSDEVRDEDKMLAHANDPIVAKRLAQFVAARAACGDLRRRGFVLGRALDRADQRQYESFNEFIRLRDEVTRHAEAFDRQKAILRELNQQVNAQLDNPQPPPDPAVDF